MARQGDESMKRFFVAASAALALPAATPAAITINVDQVGTSVVVTGSGTFNTAGLSVYATNLQGQPVINPASGIIAVGKSAPITIFTSLSGPSLGTLQGPITASSSAGDVFGFSRYLGGVYLPNTYQSGAQLSGSATYLNASFKTLGLTAGQYVYRAVNNDSVTVNIGAAAVPEPATWAMMLIGFGAVGYSLRARRKTATRFA
jgi:hypothetical protein